MPLRGRYVSLPMPMAWRWLTKPIDKPNCGWTSGVGHRLGEGAKDVAGWIGWAPPLGYALA